MWADFVTWAPVAIVALGILGAGIVLLWPLSRDRAPWIETQPLDSDR